ncbi:MAG: DUF3375 domain-containing protein [Spirochaetes bacterium]|nr:DUF3375 domain-containing protein [Spirochaetota bacterium]
MKTDKAIATYRRMRDQPLWRLLASANGPIVIGLLQSHLYTNERSLPTSIFHERIGRELESLRAQGEDLPQSAQAYISDWLSQGYLERRFPLGATEEEYELSAASVEAIRFISNIEQPHSAATESRLTLVIQALVKLAEDTNADKAKRIERLKAEQTRIKKEIEAVQKGQIRVLSDDSALERTREIISLADELTGDFRRVRDQFEHLNRKLREQLINDEENRGVVLSSVFAGMDMINESEAGKTFLAFWRLLTDPEQSATLDEALDDVLSRQFVNQLNPKDKSFLISITRNLLEQGGVVHEVMQAFARSLRNYVQSREYLEQRRLNQLLNEAYRTALSIKDEVKTTDALKYTLVLTSSRITSLSQLTLHDPTTQALPDEMKDGDAPDISLDFVAGLVAQSEIDFRSLKENIRSVLETQTQASICDILEKYPAAQGLGSVVGLVALGSKHGCKAETHETVTWTGSDEQRRSARIPKIYFLREQINELA